MFASSPLVKVPPFSISSKTSRLHLPRASTWRGSPASRCCAGVASNLSTAWPATPSSSCATSTALDAEEEKVPAIDWLAQVLFEPEKADQLKTFLIDHDQLLGLIGKKLAEHGKHYSYSQLEPFLSQIETTAREAGKTEQEKRDSFDQNVLDLYRAPLYRKLKHTLAPPPVPPESLESLREMEVEQYSDPQIQTGRPGRELTQSFRRTQQRYGWEPRLRKGCLFRGPLSRASLWSEFFPFSPGDPSHMAYRRAVPGRGRTPGIQ